MNFDVLSSQFLFTIVITLVSPEVLNLKVRYFQIRNFSHSKILLLEILTLTHSAVPATSVEDKVKVRFFLSRDFSESLSFSLIVKKILVHSFFGTEAHPTISCSNSVLSSFSSQPLLFLLPHSHNFSSRPLWLVLDFPPFGLSPSTPNSLLPFHASQKRDMTNRELWRERKRGEEKERREKEWLWKRG